MNVKTRLPSGKFAPSSRLWWIRPRGHGEMGEACALSRSPAVSPSGVKPKPYSFPSNWITWRNWQNHTWWCKNKKMTALPEVNFTNFPEEVTPQEDIEQQNSSNNSSKIIIIGAWRCLSQSTVQVCKGSLVQKWPMWLDSETVLSGSVLTALLLLQRDIIFLLEWPRNFLFGWTLSMSFKFITISMME